MGYYVVQAGSKLYRVTTAGVGVELTLPTGVTLSTDDRIRCAILNRQTVIAGSPSETLWLDPYGQLRRLAVKPPAEKMVLADTGSGTLNGAYRAKATYIISDQRSGELLAESDFGPVSDETGALVNELLQASRIPINPDGNITGRRLYRTASGPGDEYFRWLDVDGNVITQITDGLDDTGLAILEAPTDLGTPPPHIRLIVEWKDRLWAQATSDIDNCRYSGNRKHYAWPASNSFGIKPIGNDTIGINGFLPRRDELGIARRDIIYKLIGDPPNLDLVKLVEGTGVEAPDSVVVIRDVAYWLADDGVYTWGPDGVKCISDGRVRSWFTTDTYFNRSRFRYAFGRYNKRIHGYELHLSAAGSSADDRWVTYYINEGIWLGPHKTAEFTPSSAGAVRDSNGVQMQLVGDTAGFMWKLDQSTQSDGASAIDFDVQLRHNCKLPDIEKVFLEMSVLTEIEAAGTLTITPALGAVNAADQSNISHDLTLGRQRLRRISTQTQGVGRFLKLRFRNTQTAQDVVIHGYEIPWHEAGRR